MSLKDAQKVFPPEIPNRNVTLKQAQDYCTAMMADIDQDAPENWPERDKRCNRCRFNGNCMFTPDEWWLVSDSLTEDERKICRLLNAFWLMKDKQTVKLFEDPPTWEDGKLITNEIATISLDRFPSLADKPDQDPFRTPA